MSRPVKGKGTRIHDPNCQYVTVGMEPYEMAEENVESDYALLCSICFPDPYSAEYGFYDYKKKGSK